MKIIDKYISINFIKAFIVSLFAFTGIFIVSQLFKILKYLNDGRLTLEESGYYIFNLLPKIIIDVAPLAVLLGAMMTINIMASNLEIISLKTSGISFKRIVLFPIVISFFITVIVFILNDTIYPVAIKKNRELKNGQIERRELPKEKENAFFRGENKNYIYYIGKINRETGEAHKIEILDLNDDFTKLKRIILADKGTYDFKNNIWTFNSVRIISPSNSKNDQLALVFSDKKYNDSPEKFITLNVDPDILTSKEIKKQIKELKNSGGDTRELVSELAKRYSFPFASFIVSFLGLALGGKYVRGTSAVSLGICIVLGYGYYVVRASFETMSNNGLLNPFLGGWIPNIGFLALGIYFLNKAEY